MVDLIFIASNANKFLGVSQQLVVLVCVPPLVGLSLLKHMRELAYAALLADFMCILGLLVVLNIDLTYMEYDHDDIEVIGVVSAIPFFFGVASYCFEGVGMVLSLENSMRNKRNFTPILVSTVVIISSLYATFGICGYLAFGNETNAVITLNFDGGGGLAILVKVALCLGLFFTYPVMLFPVFEVLQPMLIRGQRLESPQLSQLKGTILRAGIVLVTAVIAAEMQGKKNAVILPSIISLSLTLCFLPDFGWFISLIGSTCCSLLAFILPAFFHLCLFRDEPPTRMNRLRQFFLCAMMAIGFIMLCAGVVGVIGKVL